MLAMHDNGTLGYTNPTANNPFDYLDGEYTTSTEFQRNTLRLGRCISCRGASRRACRISMDRATGSTRRSRRTPYGKTGQQSSEPVRIPAARRQRISIPGGRCSIAGNGPAVITSGMVIPRNALEGTAAAQGGFAADEGDSARRHA